MTRGYITNEITDEIKTRTDREILAWIIYSRLFGPSVATEVIGHDFKGWVLSERERPTVRFAAGE